MKKLITDIGSTIPEEFVLSEKAISVSTAKRGMKNPRAAEKLKGRTLSPEHRASLSKAMKGKPVKVTWGDKISAGKKGKKRSEADCKAISARVSKPCTVDGITIYPSLGALIKALGGGKAGRKHPNLRYIDKG